MAEVESRDLGEVSGRGDRVDMGDNRIENRGRGFFVFDNLDNQGDYGNVSGVIWSAVNLRPISIVMEE